MRKRIGAKILSVFMLILVICLAGIGIVTVQVKNMDKINQNIGNEYLNSIQEVNTLSVNEAYLENDLKDYMLKEDKDSIRSDITSAQGNVLSSLQALEDNAISERQKETIQRLKKAYDAYIKQYSAVLEQIQGISKSGKSAASAWASSSSGIELIYSLPTKITRPANFFWIHSKMRSLSLSALCTMPVINSSSPPCTHCETVEVCPT